jgi:hypothetical protein
MTAKSVILKDVLLDGAPGPEHFNIVETAAPTEDDCQDGDILVNILCISADPYLRG